MSRYLIAAGVLSLLGLILMFGVAPELTETWKGWGYNNYYQVKGELYWLVFGIGLLLNSSALLTLVVGFIQAGNQNEASAKKGA